MNVITNMFSHSTFAPSSSFLQTKKLKLLSKVLYVKVQLL